MGDVFVTSDECMSALHGPVRRREVSVAACDLAGEVAKATCLTERQVLDILVCVVDAIGEVGGPNEALLPKIVDRIEDRC